MSTMYLIRHGITEGNEKRLYYGKTDLPLTEQGINAIRERVQKGLYPSNKNLLLVTSSRRRTEETLFAIYGTVSHRTDPRLDEMDFGVFEMKSYEELKKREDYQNWISGDNWSNVCPGGESGEQMERRFLEALADYKDHDTFIVCHGGMISAYLWRLFPKDSKRHNFYEWTPKPGEGYKIDFENGVPVKYQTISLR